MRKSSRSLWLGGSLVAVGVITWTVVLIYPEVGRNATEAMAMALFGVATPAIGGLVIVGGLIDRFRSSGKD